MVPEQVIWSISIHGCSASIALCYVFWNLLREKRSFSLCILDRGRKEQQSLVMLHGTREVLKPGILLPKPEPRLCYRRSPPALPGG